MYFVKRLANYIENMTLTDGMMSKLKFINLVFDLEEYFNFGVNALLVPTFWADSVLIPVF